MNIRLLICLIDFYKQPLMCMIFQGFPLLFFFSFGSLICSSYFELINKVTVL